MAAQDAPAMKRLPTGPVACTGRMRLTERGVSLLKPPPFPRAFQRNSPLYSNEIKDASIHPQRRMPAAWTSAHLKKRAEERMGLGEREETSRKQRAKAAAGRAR